MKYSDSVFDILTPVELLYSIEQSFEKYKAVKQRNIESLLYVVMGLTHLREWIAPGYECKGKCEKTPKNDEEEFSKKIYENHDGFTTIRMLCNRTKHLKKTNFSTSSSHDLSFDEWTDFDAVRDFNKGPATDYYVDNRNIIEVIEAVIDYYKKEWFIKQKLIT